MTGPEHYREAERLAELATKSGHRDAYAALAQVHSTLALAAATAMSAWNETGMPQPDRMDWWRAASGEPAERKRIKEAEAAEVAEWTQEPQS